MNSAKRFKLTTHQLQLIVIATIDAETDKFHKEQGWDKDYDELTELFAELNRMVNEENNYTVNVEVYA